MSQGHCRLYHMGKSNKSGGKKTMINFRGSVWAISGAQFEEERPWKVAGSAKTIWLEGKNGDFNERSGNKRPESFVDLGLDLDQEGKNRNNKLYISLRFYQRSVTLPHAGALALSRLHLTYQQQQQTHSVPKTIQIGKHDCKQWKHV